MQRHCVEGRHVLHGQDTLGGIEKRNRERQCGSLHPERDELGLLVEKEHEEHSAVGRHRQASHEARLAGCRRRRDKRTDSSAAELDRCTVRGRWCRCHWRVRAGARGTGGGRQRNAREQNCADV